MFVAAGLHTITSIFNRKYQNKKVLVETYVNRGLSSFGRKIGKKYPSNYIKGFLGTLSSMSSYNIEKYIDSGGYQIATLQIPKEFIYKYINDYAEFLAKYKDSYDYAFSLDIPNNINYSDKEESIRLNEEALSTIVKKDPIEKILFVLQFRTLDLYETWEPLVNKYLNVFSNYSIGGLVVAQQSMKLLPFSFTAIGIGTLLCKLKKKSAKFHILGNSTYKDAIFYMLLERHIREVFGINLTITYDSSNLFKKFQMARCFTYWDQKNYKSILLSAKEKDLDTKVYRGKTAFEIIKEECENMAKGCNLTESFPDKIYNEDRSFKKEYAPYTLILEGYEQIKFEKWARVQTDFIYSFYKKDKRKFTEMLTKVLLACNNNAINNAQIITNTLDLLNSDLTIDKIKKIMKSYAFLTDSESFEKPASFDF